MFSPEKIPKSSSINMHYSVLYCVCSDVTYLSLFHTLHSILFYYYNDFSCIYPVQQLSDTAPRGQCWLLRLGQLFYWRAWSNTGSVSQELSGLGKYMDFLIRKMQIPGSSTEDMNIKKAKKARLVKSKNCESEPEKICGTLWNQKSLMIF